jgi:hypothetical protein
MAAKAEVLGGAQEERFLVSKVPFDMIDRLCRHNEALARAKDAQANWWLMSQVKRDLLAPTSAGSPIMDLPCVSVGHSIALLGNDRPMRPTCWR